VIELLQEQLAPRPDAEHIIVGDLHLHHPFLYKNNKTFQVMGPQAIVLFPMANPTPVSFASNIGLDGMMRKDNASGCKHSARQTLPQRRFRHPVGHLVR